MGVRSGAGPEFKVLRVYAGRCCRSYPAGSDISEINANNGQGRGVRGVSPAPFGPGIRREKARCARCSHRIL